MIILIYKIYKKEDDDSMERLDNSVFSMIPEYILEDVMEKLAQNTNISVGLMDFQGNIQTFRMGEISCDLCRKRRISQNLSRDCCRTDAYAAIEAARREETYIYTCRYGLIDMAAPIIVEGEYLGALFMGQLRTDEEHMKTLPKVMPFFDELSQREYDEMFPLYEEEKENIHVVPYEDLKKYACMEYYAAKYISEVCAVQKQKLLLENEKNRTELTKRDALQAKEFSEKLETSNMALREYPSFILNTLNTINQLAIIEEAPRTVDTIQKLANCLREAIEIKSAASTLNQEIELVKEYLSIQELVYQNINQVFNVHTDHLDCVLPRTCLLAIVANCYQHAFFMHDKNAYLKIEIEDIRGNLRIRISDNGRGTPYAVQTELLNYWHDLNSPVQRVSSLYFIIRFLKQRYGNWFQFDIKNGKTGGTTIDISISETVL